MQAAIRNLLTSVAIIFLVFSLAAGVAVSSDDLQITPEDDFSSSGNVGGPFEPPQKTYQLTNTGTESIYWGADKTASWLDISPTWGTLDPNQSATFTVSLNAQANTLPPGTYTDTLTFTNLDTGYKQTRGVILTVSAGAGILQVTPDSNFEPSGLIGGPFSPGSKDYQLTNIGQHPLYWGAEKNVTWLDLSDTWGQLDPNQSTVVTVSLNSQAETFDPGTYTDTITFLNISTETPYTRDVILTVFAPAGIWAEPASFELTLKEGTSQTRILTLGNNGSNQLNFTLRTRKAAASTGPAAQSDQASTPTVPSAQEYKSSSLPKNIDFNGRPCKPGELLVRFAPTLNHTLPSTAGKNAILLALGNRHNYATLTSELQAYAAAHPGICRLISLGQSVQGRELWAMLITDNPDDEEDEPEFKYVGNMHGNEWLGLEMCLYFIDMLLNDYGSVGRITDLVDSTAIWVVPSMNPDGLEANTRYNANGYDLYGSFPDYPDELNDNIFDGAPLNDAGRQPEVYHIMHWSIKNSFTLSADLHTGALCVMYPYNDDDKGSVYSPTPDDDLYTDISKRYSIYNLPMWNNPAFAHGITNGAVFFPSNGVMNDCNYRYLSCNAVTIELCNSHNPPTSEIPDYWEDNCESMLTFVEAAHIGVRGIVTDRATGMPLWAKVNVVGNTHPVFTDPTVGDYHRMLLPGTYDLVFDAPGYAPVTVENINVIDGLATRIDVQLTDADLNDDGEINETDFALFSGHWMDTDCAGAAECKAADFNGDGQVGTVDLMLLSESWLKKAGLRFRVYPEQTVNAVGVVGGQINPACISYNVTNRSNNLINFSVTKTQNWIDLIPENGTLGPYASTTVQICFNADAESLAEGIYGDSITFTDNTNNINVQREIILEVKPKLLLAYWNFDEGAGSTAGDVSGNGHDGTLVGTPQWITGKIDQALDFDGSNDYVVVGQDASLQTSSVLVAAWASIDRFTNWDGIVGYCQDNQLDESGWYLCTYGGHVEWCVSVNGSLRCLSCYPPASTWTHFVGTYDGQDVRLYVNGLEVGSGIAASGAIDWTFTPLDLNIGRYHDDNENIPFDGRIDDVRIYNYALSAPEVENLYNGIDP
jgi:carboxypeptidase D